MVQQTYTPYSYHTSEEEDDDDDNNGSAAITTTMTTSSPNDKSGTRSGMVGISFWLLGLLNNSSYVIMIASAKTISEGGTALVFLANILPSMVIKLTAPYWFDSVSYKTRMIVATLLMVSSFAVVATLSNPNKNDNSTTTTKTNSNEAEHEMGSGTTTTAMTLLVGLELLGVALGSAQAGLGEASLLAAAGKCDPPGQEGQCISYFSSGTGLAGVFGFAWKFVFNEFLGLTMSTTLWAAQILAILYIGIFVHFLSPHLTKGGSSQQAQSPSQPSHEYDALATTTELTTYHDHSANPTAADNYSDEYVDPLAFPNNNQQTQQQQSSSCNIPVHEMTVRQKLRLVLSLWPYIIPLFVVYAAEYSLQAGTWTAIGFPTYNEKARDEFYEYSNWMYQAGVFVSRSSGALGLGTASMTLLWLMPTLQALNVGFFTIVASQHIWYSYGQLLPICFYVGLLGGAVYVHGYMRICSDFSTASSRTDRKEFALAATSVAEAFGIVVADILGLFIQSCLYRTNNIDGAIVSCPIR